MSLWRPHVSSRTSHLVAISALSCDNDDMPGKEMLYRLQQTLRINQKQLAELLGCSPRTIIRYYDRGTTVFLPSQYENLARAAHPIDRALAAEMAGYAGKTLVDLGLESPPAPPAPPAPERTAPSSKHLVDSVVCAAAEAMQTPPHAMRPALVAAFERAVALGMTMEGVIEGLGTTKAGKAKA
jgi:hypothetical protein